MIPVGSDHTWGYELFQSLVIQGGQPLGAAFTELHHSHGLLSSQSTDILPFTDHLEQTERAIDAIEKLLPGCQLVHLCDREFDDLQLLRHLGDRPFVIRCKHLSRLVTVHGKQQSLRHCADRVKLREAGQVVRRLEHGTQTYTLWVGQTVVTMKGKSLRGVARNKNSPKPGKALRVRVVVSELREPGQEPLRWVLLTNLKDSALSVVESYLERCIEVETGLLDLEGVDTSDKAVTIVDKYALQIDTEGCLVGKSRHDDGKWQATLTGNPMEGPAGAASREAGEGA